MIKDIRLIGYGRDKCKPDKKRVYTIPDFYMIHFIEQGSGFFNGKKLTKGQAFICRRDKICHYFPDKKEPWTYSWINIKGSGADQIIDTLNLDNDIFNWNPLEDSDMFSKISECKNSTYSEELMAVSILLGIFAKASSYKKDYSPNYVSEAKRIFKNGFHKGITVEQTAKILNISRGHLRNVFFKAEGKSPQRYLMDIKMKRAEELLKGKYSITEIALAVGYTDVLQFSKIFSKYHGISPTEYKNRFS